MVERNGRKMEFPGVCSMHGGIFDLEHVKVIWGHSVHYSEKKSRNSKAARRSAKRTKNGPRGFR